jgi:hypothetical protein
MQLNNYYHEASRQNIAPLFLGSATWVVLVALAYAIVLIAPGDAPLPLLVVLSGMIMTGSLAHATVSNSSRPLLLLVSIYFCSFYILPGLLHAQMESFPFFGSRYDQHTLHQASKILFVFTICFLLPYYLTTRSQAATAEKPTGGTEDTLRMGRCAVSMLVLGLIAYLAAGPSTFMTNRGDITAGMQSSPLELIFVSLAKSCSFFSLVLGIMVYSRTKEKFWLGFLVISASLLLITNLPTTTARSQIAAYVIAAALIFFKTTVARRVGFIALILLGQVTIFPMLSNLARGDSNTEDLSIIDYLSTHGDFDGFQSTINVYLFTEGAGFGYGRQLASAVLFFIPRGWWPGKSIGTGGDTAEFMGYSFNNLSAPLPAEFFVDFGWIGLVLLSAIAGWVFARVDRYFHVSVIEGYKTSMLAPALLCGFSFILMRGALVGVLGPIVLSVSLALLVKVYCTRENRPH